MCHAVLAVVSNCCPPLKGRFLTRYSPVRHCPHLPLSENSFQWFSFDLHVLSTPPAFVLSQDQTLYKSYQHSVSAELIILQNYFHSFINSAQTPGNWLNPSVRAFQSRIFRCAPVWCFVRSLFNLQDTRSASAEQLVFYHKQFRLSRTFFDILHIFWNRLSFIVFADDLFRIPHRARFVKNFFWEVLIFFGSPCPRRGSRRQLC